MAIARLLSPRALALVRSLYRSASTFLFHSYAQHSVSFRPLASAPFAPQHLLRLCICPLDFFFCSSPPSFGSALLFWVLWSCLCLTLLRHRLRYQYARLLAPQEQSSAQGGARRERPSRFESACRERQRRAGDGRQLRLRPRRARRRLRRARCGQSALLLLFCSFCSFCSCAQASPLNALSR